MAYKSGASVKADLDAAHDKAMSAQRAGQNSGGAGSGVGNAPKMTPVSKGHKPDGPHGRAAVAELGRTKTTGNFAKIAASKGKGAAIAAFQNARRAHQNA